MIDTERKEDLFLDTKLIKSENRLGKLRIIDELHPVLGGQPTHEADQPNDNNPFLDLACTMQFTIDKVNAVDKKADTKLAKAQNLKDVANIAIARDNLGLGTSATMNATSTLSDRTDQTATIKAVNDVNRAASTAQKTANTANDKANAAQATADRKLDVPKTIGDGPEFMLKGAGGLLADLPIKNIDFSQFVRTSFLGLHESDNKEYYYVLTMSHGERNNGYLLLPYRKDQSPKIVSRTEGKIYEFDLITSNDLATKNTAGVTRLDSSLSDAEDCAATPKVVNAVNRTAISAQEAADNALSVANTKITGGSIVQTLGNSTDNVMSQNAVKTELLKRGMKNSSNIHRSGWWKCGDTEIIIQWGYIAAPNSVIFPISFTEIPRVSLAVVGTPNRSDNVFVSNITNTGFSSSSRTPSGGVEVELQATFIAIGY